MLSTLTWLDFKIDGDGISLLDARFAVGMSFAYSGHLKQDLVLEKEFQFKTTMHCSKYVQLRYWSIYLFSTESYVSLCVLWPLYIALHNTS